MIVGGGYKDAAVGGAVFYANPGNAPDELPLTATNDAQENLRAKSP